MSGFNVNLNGLNYHPDTSIAVCMYFLVCVVLYIITYFIRDTGTFSPGETGIYSDDMDKKV